MAATRSLQTRAAVAGALGHHQENSTPLIQRPDYVVRKAASPRVNEIGTSGLRQFGGYVLEEWLTQIQGRRAAWVWREMMDNSPVVGAILFAIDWLSKTVEYRVEGKDPQAEFVESCMHDLNQPWPEMISECLSCLPYGWCYSELVYKRRDGYKERASNPNELARTVGLPQDTQENTNNRASSQFTDGKIGWRKISPRAQETLLRWVFDGYSGLRAMEQIDWHGGDHVIPIEKALLFRSRPRRNNPEGYALDMDCPIPTPDGWKTMGDLRVGSRVFDEQGRVRYVTATADWEDRPCYRLTFSDKTSIIADENHQWLTQKLWERNTSSPAVVRNTAEIAESVKTANDTSNHSIEWAAPLEYAEQHLAIDPYLLGLWLGDGSKTAARITCHADDVEEQAVLVEATGYATVVRQNGAAGGSGRTLDVQAAKPWVDSPQAALRHLSVLQNKHIPSHYLRGSYEQRLALLQGLMDSDGHVDNLGRCEFTNSNRTLIDGVAELVRSLGMSARPALRRHAGEGKHIIYRSDHYAVKFSPRDFVPFRLRRKAERVEAHLGRDRSRRRHYIVSAERVENRRTRCIEVDSPSHLFLAGEGMVPTHNSILRTAYTSYFMLKNIQQIEAIGIERDLAGLPVLTPPEGVDIFAPGNSALLQKAQQLVTGVKRDEDAGIILPTAGWQFELISSGGSRQIDTDEVVRRYEQRIATSMLADFILVGQDTVGSYAMVDIKTDLFGVALDGILDSICDVFNRYAIPRLLKMNGMSVENPPKITHGSAGRIALEKVGTFLQSLALAGAPIPWSVELIRDLFLDAGLPTNFEEHEKPEVLPTLPRPPMPVEPVGTGTGASGSATRVPASGTTAQAATQQVAKDESIWGDESVLRLNPPYVPAKEQNEVPLQKATRSQTDHGTAIHVGPYLHHRAQALSAQLDREIQSALSELGERAASAYLNSVQKANRPNIRKIVQRALAAINIQGWVQNRLRPILHNHAARVIVDTNRVLNAEIKLGVHVADEKAAEIANLAGVHLQMADIEAQVRESIATAIEQGFERGENPITTARRIREMVPPGRFVHAGSKYRAQLIARNETANLQREATLAAYQSNPNIAAVRLTDGIYGPPRSDGACMGRDGVVVSVAQAGSVHPYHPMCTLGFEPVVRGSLPSQGPAEPALA